MKLGMIVSLVLATIVSTALAQSLAKQLPWSLLKKTGQLTVGEILPDSPSGDREELKIDNPTNQPRTVTLLDLKTPGVKTIHYALDGSVL
jgi:hypothetical protein